MNAAQQRRLTPVLAGVVVLLGILLLVLLGGVGRGTRWAPPRTLPALPSAERSLIVRPPASGAPARRARRAR